jgi:signal transduction histidine kinase
MGEGPAARQRSRLQLDDVLSRPTAQAHEVTAAQDRMRALLRANQAIMGQLSLGTVLHRIVEVACQLVGAPYGALGVINADGLGLEQFIHTGMDVATVDRIGHLPEGKGLLGALIVDPRPIRLREIGQDPRSVGFPAAHPQMKGFLGVPIRVRDEVFGNLYLASLNEGEFTAEDEELVSALAATAGVAIENARLYEEATRRQEWLEASNDTTRRVLVASEDEALRMVGRRVAELADADLVAVVLPAGAGTLRVAVAVGLEADRLVDYTYPQSGSVSQDVMRTGEPQVFAEAHQLHWADPPRQVVMVARVVPLGATMVLPLAGAEEVRGVLVVGRRPGRPSFAEADVAMATNFAHHASVALELAEKRREAQRMVLLEDRARIARDLHDHVIQQLFAAGMTLHGAATSSGGSSAADVIEAVVDQIDDAIRQIRTSIFELRPSGVVGDGLRAGVLGVVADVRASLGFAPRVQFTGPVEAVTDRGLVDDVSAVVREALTNAARHAEAGSVSVMVTVRAGVIHVVVRDDGHGMGATERRSGLANLRQRAEARGGRLEVGPGPDGAGTQLTWAALVRPGREEGS